MTLNRVIGLISSNFIALQDNYVTVVEDKPMMSTKYSLPVIFGQNWLTQQLHGLFATAKLLAIYSCAPFHYSNYPVCKKLLFFNE